MLEQRSKYDINGYFIEKNFFTIEEIERLNNQTTSIFAQWSSANLKQIRHHKLVNMSGLTQRKYFADSPSRIAFFESVFSKKLWRLVSGVFGDEIRFHNTQLFFNPDDPAQLPYWHRDLQYSDVSDAVQQSALAQMLSLHCRIPLVAETGIVLVPGSHGRWDTEREFAERSKNVSEVPLPGEHYIDLDVGDMLVFNAQMIHRGHYNKTSERKALDLCVGKRHELLADSVDASVFPSQEEMQVLSNQQWYR
jgi:ectoine hydroxylase-related dioxygenase (phytanoyl-CoA dioxygenase family)